MENSLIHLASTTSVMDEAFARLEKMREASSGRKWVAVTADQQTQGRGRQGNSWEERPGLKYAWGTLGMCSPLITARVGIYLSQNLKEEPYIKWVNDLMVGERKCGGILVEARTQGSLVRTVVGIGINSQATDHTSFGACPSVVDLNIEKLSMELQKIFLLSATTGSLLLDQNELQWLNSHDFLKNRELSLGNVHGTGSGWLADGGYRIGHDVIHAGSVNWS